MFTISIWRWLVKDDIESAERMTLIVSWLGTLSALAVIGYTLLTFS